MPAGLLFARTPPGFLNVRIYEAGEDEQAEPIAPAGATGNGAAG